MCGIVAIFKRWATACSAGDLVQTRDEVAHRGPDDQGAVFFAEGIVPRNALSPDDSYWNVGLGHQRLSILDLSPTWLEEIFSLCDSLREGIGRMAAFR